MTERRCHYSTFIINTLKAIWAVLAVIIAIIIQSGDSEEMLSEIGGYRFWVFIALVALAIATLVINFIRWRKTFVYLDEENLVVDKRTINNSHTVVKLSTIASVNIRQGILEKLFGAYRLQLDINSSATADSRPFDLVFAKKEALAIRAQLLAGAAAGKASPADGLSTAQRMAADANTSPDAGSLADGELPAGSASSSAAVPNEATATWDEGELICQFRFREVIRHCLLSLSLVSIIGAATGFVLWFISSGISDGKSISWLPIALVFFPAVYQFIRPFFLYYNFCVRKQGNHLYVSYGLIATQHFSLPLDKTNGIIIRRPMLARAFNLCSGEIINVGMGDNEENQAPVFCLLTSPHQMQSIIAAIAPSYAEAAQAGSASPLIRSPKAALAPTMVKWGLLGLLGLAAAIAFGKWWIGAIILAFCLLCAFWQWKTKELALLDKKLSISSGIFSKRNITIDYERLQSLSRFVDPISRRYHLTRGMVTILAAAANRANTIGYFPNTYFDRIEEEILRSAAAKNIVTPSAEPS